MIRIPSSRTEKRSLRHLDNKLKSSAKIIHPREQNRVVSVYEGWDKGPLAGGRELENDQSFFFLIRNLYKSSHYVTNTKQTKNFTDFMVAKENSVIKSRLQSFCLASLGVYNTSLPLDYSVLLNAGTERPLSRSAGPQQFLLLDGLDPYTSYEIRVQACQAGAVQLFILCN